MYISNTDPVTPYDIQAWGRGVIWHNVSQTTWCPVLKLDHVAVIVGNPADRCLIFVPENLVCIRTEKSFVSTFLCKSGLNSYGSDLTVKVGY